MLRFFRRYPIRLLFGVLLLAGVVCWIIVLAATTRSVNRDTFAQIKTGMTLSEVEDLLGGSANQRGYGLTVGLLAPGGGSTKTWVSHVASDKGADAIMIAFDTNDRVVAKAFYDTWPRQPSRWQQFLDWLGL